MCLRFLILLGLLLNYQSTYAKHFLGGQINFEVISESEHNVDILLELELHMDSVAAYSYNEPEVLVGMYYKKETWAILQEFQIPFVRREVVQTTGLTDCNIIQREVKIYQKIISIGRSEDDYMFTYLRCCRPPSLVNMVDPDENGNVLQMVLKSQNLEIGDRSAIVLLKDNFHFIVNSDNSYDMEFDAASDFTFDIARSKQIGGRDGEGGPATGDAFSCTGIMPKPSNCPPPYSNIELPTGFSEESQFMSSDFFSVEDRSILVHPTVTGHYSLAFEIKGYKDDQVLYSKLYDNVFEVIACMPSDIHNVEYIVPKLRNSLVNNILHIEQSTNSIEYIILNQSGQRVKYGNAHNMIAIDELANGVYFLKIISSDKYRSFRFIKQSM